MTIAYLVNQYPKVSHSFIRREIGAIAIQGIPVTRFSIQSCAAELVDPADQMELEKTQIVLEVGALRLLASLVSTALLVPRQFLQALALTLKIGFRSDRGILRHLAYLAEACVLRTWFRAAGVTHIHAHFGTNSATVAMLSSLLTGSPYSFTVHGPEEFDRAPGLALEEKIERAAFVVTISSFSKSQLYRLCDRDQWPKIHVVHCGLDSAFLDQPPTPVPDTAQLVCVGRLCEQKGQLLLIDAAHQLVAEGTPLQLLLVGDGPLRSELEALIAHYQLEEQVTITGWADSSNVKQHILNSRALVLPSFAEGLPVVLMEALALHRPVISTYIAGIPELVEPGRSGWLIPAGSTEALVEAMRAALSCAPEQLAQMGKVGAERVAQQHNIELEAAKLAALCRASGCKSDL